MMTIDRWITHLKRPEYLAASNPTRCDYEHEYSVLRGVFTFYPDHIRRLKVKEKLKQVKDLTVDDFKNFIARLKEDCYGTKWEVIYYLALAQYSIYGRVQEAAALHVEDFQFARGKVFANKKVIWMRAKGLDCYIEDGAKADGGKEIPISALAAKVFKEWTLRLGIRSGLLFTYEGKLIEYRQIQHRYDNALKRAGLPFSATHLLRHASLTEFYDSSEDILSTQKMAGHRDLKSTARYAKARDKKVMEGQQKMDLKFASFFD